MVSQASPYYCLLYYCSHALMCSGAINCRCRKYILCALCVIKLNDSLTYGGLQLNNSFGQTNWPGPVASVRTNVHTSNISTDVYKNNSSYLHAYICGMIGTLEHFTCIHPI